MENKSTSRGCTKKNMLVIVKPQKSPDRGWLWRVCVFIDGQRFIRPGFQRQKPAIKLAAMMVQQAMIHGWRVDHKVIDENGVVVNINLAAIGSKMERGERKSSNGQPPAVRPQVYRTVVTQVRPGNGQ